MIEIIVLYRLCSFLGYRAREKGRKAIKYLLLLILFWFSGEFSTAIIAVFVLPHVYDAQIEEYVMWGYIASLAGAVIGAWIAFRIVATLPEPGSDDLA